MSLDDILANAEVTKGAMYFHFRSKHALAEAIIDERTSITRDSIIEIMGRKLSGLETIIDIVYLSRPRLHDRGRPGRAEPDGFGRRIEGVQAKRLDEWIKGMTRRWPAPSTKATSPTARSRRRCPPDHLDVHRDQADHRTQTMRAVPTQHGEKLEPHPARVRGPDRIDYFSQFIRRRTVHALKNWRT